jgi:hypothetical protein
VCILKVIEDIGRDPHQHPDRHPDLHPLVRGMNPRIRIRTKISRIWNTVCNLMFFSKVLDPSAVAEKIRRLRTGGCEELQFVVDFDFTLTRANT